MALFIIFLVFGILIPERFFSLMNIRTIVTQAAVLCVAGFGMALVIISGSIDLSVGSIAGLASILAAILARSHGPLQGLLVGTSVGLILGLMNGMGFVYLKIPSFLITLAMLTSARGLAYLISNGESFVVYGMPLLGRMGAFPEVIIIVAILFPIMWLTLNRTTIGLYLRAIGGNERVAGLVGIPNNRIKVFAFAASGFLAALTGIILASRQGASTPNLGLGLELDIIAINVLGGTPLTGGIGDMTNTIIGAIAIASLANGLVILGLNTDVQMIIKGLVLVMAILVSLQREKIGIIK
jgi:ribose/xylose/arabinose/galactoside ABC-type transport system permease subunit